MSRRQDKKVEVQPKPSRRKEDMGLRALPKNIKRAVRGGPQERRQWERTGSWTVRLQYRLDSDWARRTADLLF